jgi:hypothetical protein
MEHRSLSLTYDLKVLETSYLKISNRLATIHFKLSPGRSQDFVVEQINGFLLRNLFNSNLLILSFFQ